MNTKTTLRKNTRFSEKKILKILEYFIDDMTATYTSKKMEIWRKTINDWYRYFREIIVWNSEQEKEEKLQWNIELDESYFWPKRIRWKRWRWAWMKTIVFWILKREWKVYTEIIPDAKAHTLKKIIRWKIDIDSVINTDWWRWYHWLVDMWFEKHHRVHHWKNDFWKWKRHVNWIESFWSFTKRRFTKFNGIKKEYFIYFLKESEFRYNVKLSNENMTKKMIKLMKKFTKQLP